MGINYPGNPPGTGFDTFSVPKSPESTPLSEAGAGNTRDHSQLHADIGQAVEQLEDWSTLYTHDHSGQNPPTAHGPRLIQANTHEEPDTDSSAYALHHTLTNRLPGTAVPSGLIPDPSYQAAPGNHTHYYQTILDTPLQLVTSLTRPQSPQMGDLIYESDTQRMRAWGTWAGAVLNSGLYSIDYFTRLSDTDLGTTLWTQTYMYGAPPGNGTMATPDGATAAWMTSGNTMNRCLAQRINPADSVTQGDDQILSWTTGQQTIQWDLDQDTSNSTNSASMPALNDGYLRMSGDMSSYIRVSVGYAGVAIAYTTGGPAAEVLLYGISANQIAQAITGVAGVLVKVYNDFASAVDSVSQLLGFNILPIIPASATQPAYNTAIANALWVATVVGNSVQLSVNGHALISAALPANAAKGPNNRGWGIGMQAGNAFLGGQTAPANIDWVSISDNISVGSATRWGLLAAAAKPHLILQQTIPQTIGTNGAQITWNSVIEDSFGYWNPGANQILVTEPGLYQVSATVIWQSSINPSVAAVEIGLDNNATVSASPHRIYASSTAASVTATGTLRIAAQQLVTVFAQVVQTGATFLTSVINAVGGPTTTSGTEAGSGGTTSRSLARRGATGGLGGVLHDDPANGAPGNYPGGGGAGAPFGLTVGGPGASGVVWIEAVSASGANQPEVATLTNSGPYSPPAWWVSGTDSLYIVALGGGGGGGGYGNLLSGMGGAAGQFATHTLTTLTGALSVVIGAGGAGGFSTVGGGGGTTIVTVGGATLISAAGGAGGSYGAALSQQQTYGAGAGSVSYGGKTWAGGALAVAMQGFAPNQNASSPYNYAGGVNIGPGGIQVIPNPSGQNPYGSNSALGGSATTAGGPVSATTRCDAANNIYSWVELTYLGP